MTLEVQISGYVVKAQAPYTTVVNDSGTPVIGQELLGGFYLVQPLNNAVIYLNEPHRIGDRIEDLRL